LLLNIGIPDRNIADTIFDDFFFVIQCGVSHRFEEAGDVDHQENQSDEEQRFFHGFTNN
jgi:hypothetical protein